VGGDVGFGRSSDDVFVESIAGMEATQSHEGGGAGASFCGRGGFGWAYRRTGSHFECLSVVLGDETSPRDG
jgi:hypothetical protein